MKEAFQYLKQQSSGKALRLRFTNLPVLIFFVITFMVIIYYSKENSWQAALNPETLKPLMALASLLSLVIYFAFGRFGLKMLITFHIMASIALIANRLIGSNVSVADIVNDLLQRIVIIVIGFCLYLWDKEREERRNKATRGSASEQNRTLHANQ